MEEKKLKTLQEEYRSLNQKYKKSEDSLAEHKEAKNKLEAKLKVVNDEVDRKIEEATGKWIQNLKLLMNLNSYCRTCFITQNCRLRRKTQCCYLSAIS